MTELTFGVTTWIKYPARFAYLTKSIHYCKERLDFGGLNIRYLISAETADTKPEDREKLISFCADNSYELIWHEGAPDLGANLNHLLDHVQTDVVLYVQDDYAPDVDIYYLDRDVKYLSEHEDIGIIRYPFHDHFIQPEWEKIQDGHYVKLPRDMPYYYSDAPHLQHRRWRERAGRYAEYTGQTLSENRMNEQAIVCDLSIIARNQSSGFSHKGIVSTVPEKWGVVPDEKYGQE